MKEYKIFVADPTDTQMVTSLRKNNELPKFYKRATLIVCSNEMKELEIWEELDDGYLYLGKIAKIF